MNTKIDYLYRDAANYKVLGSIIVEGKVTLWQLKPFLDENGAFIPDQVDMRELQDELTSFPSEDDHVWHELLDAKPTDDEPDHEDSAEELLRKFSEVKRWDEAEASRRLGIK